MLSRCAWAFALGWLLHTQPLLAQSSDDAALDLKAEEPAAADKKPARSLRVFGELAAGRLSLRGDGGSDDVRRASLDLYWEFKPAAQFRGVISNRLDDMHPVDPGSRSTLNSLREAYVGWLSEDSRYGVDFGRLNLRNGPAYGFNPTDYFRDGASRAVTSADPLALRENRLGTVMLRVQRLWDGGNVSLAVAPDIANGPSSKSFSVDLGATNHSDRVLGSVSLQLGAKTSAQGLAFYERGRGLQIGASATTLLNDATVAFVEWSGGRDATLLSQALGAARNETQHRAALGLTYTTASRLALTAELEYNGFALSKRQWSEVRDTLGVDALNSYLFNVQARQDIASRKALLIYASQKDALVKNLELTGLIRRNLDDHSSFAWVEARYHWPRFDLALQWQANLGKSTSEYGSQPGSRLVQLLAVAYF